jgi:hypothetical protein
MKRFLSSVLMVIMIVSLTVQGQAATIQEVLNREKLEPVRVNWLYGTETQAQIDMCEDYIKSVDDMIVGKKTNYDKLVAIFNAVVNDPVLNAQRKTGNNCTAYEATRYNALTVAGFTSYAFRGNITTVNGGVTGHSWNGIDIGGQLFFMDAFMTASGSKSYFLMAQNKGTMYSDIIIGQADVPLGIVTKMAWLSNVDTATKRLAYKPVLDWVAEPGVFYKMSQHQLKGHTLSDGKNYGNNDTIRTISKRGVIITIYADGRPTTYETPAEEAARIAKEKAGEQEAYEENKQRILDEAAAAREAERDRLIAERDAELAERRESSTARQHRHRNPDGTYGPWEEGPYDG